MSSAATPLVLVNTFQPALYKLDLRLSSQKSNFNGQLTIELTRDSKPVPESKDFSFILHCSELVILNAFFKTSTNETHKAKVTYDRINETAIFVVEDGKSLQDEQSLFLSISYIGKINTIRTYRDFTKGVFKTNYLDDRTNTATNFVIATHSQASFARSIFPSIDEPVSKAKFKLSIQTDSKFKVLSNTLPESNQVLDANTQEVIFNETPVMNTSIFAFVVGDLDFIESKVTLKNKTIPVRLFTTIGNISGAAYSLYIAQKTLPFIESQFGSDYPLDKLDFVALPFLSDGAMENFGLVTIQSNHILIQSLGNQEMNQSIRQIIVHEIIHHWVGNNVSFDEWDHLWLNESFATWFAFYVLYKLDLDPLDSQIWEVQTDREFKTLIDSNSSINALPVLGSKKAKTVKSTQDAFEVNSYQKGIQFLRMLANVFESNQFNDDLPKFIEVLSQFIIKNEFKSIKPLDLWKFLSDNSKLDLITFTQSWLRVPGLPIVTVSVNADDQIKIVQHRFLDHSDVESQNLEDVPYHVPLAIKLTDGSVVNQILTDRKLILQDIKLEEFVKLNTNRIGFYITQYNDLKFFENLCSKIDEQSTADLVGLISDLSQVIGHDTHQNDTAVAGLIKLAEALVDQSTLNFVVLNHVLQELRVIQDSFKLFVESSKYKQFEKWLTRLNLKLFKKIQWNPETYYRLTISELESRKSILLIGLNTPDIASISTTLFKHLLHGPARSVPVEWLEPALSTTAITASPTTWKRILELAKQPAGIVDHVIDGTGPDIQHAALGALGYTKDPELAKRVLNFVKDNVDFKLVELGLIGLQNDHERNFEALWHWFNLNYNQWIPKTLREGSETSANLKRTIDGITVIVFSWMNTEKEQKLIDQFVKDKLKSLPEHGLEETLELVKSSQAEKKKVAESFESILQYI